MAIELETHWVADNVFEESSSGGTDISPQTHFNYRIGAREHLASTNLEVFVEEEHGVEDVADGLGTGVVRTIISSVSSPPAHEMDSRGGSTGSSSSIGLKYTAGRKLLCYIIDGCMLYIRL